MVSLGLAAGLADVTAEIEQQVANLPQGV